MSYQIVRLKKAGVVFEILCKPGAALIWRDGSQDKSVVASEVLFADDVFKGSAAAGEKPSSAELEAAFGSDDVAQCALAVLRDGELQLSAAERKRLTEQKRLALLYYVHKNYVDPTSANKSSPHPMTRLESALDTMKLKVTADAPLHRLVDEFVKKSADMRVPLKKMEAMVGTIKVPLAFSGQARPLATKNGASVNGEEWTSTHLELSVALAPSDFDAVSRAFADLTKGDFSIDIEGGNPEPSAESSQQSKKGGKGKKKR